MSIALILAGYAYFCLMNKFLTLAWTRCLTGPGHPRLMYVCLQGPVCLTGTEADLWGFPRPARNMGDLENSDQMPLSSSRGLVGSVEVERRAVRIRWPSFIRNLLNSVVIEHEELGYTGCGNNPRLWLLHARDRSHCAQKCSQKCN
ncbi:hypothetical protein EJ06DRAFT_119745 [Trichodelitschia bisporula]|uniref:Uncharacterized protein n=1 Tax=Trichodelitschia bisporula TaxID=703511 RepID=A0A6G1HQ71_9PEZI|nr:hypothetical protein EJ06DRAFT_119745 [Trichodelitschia bisporula]